MPTHGPTLLTRVVVAAVAALVALASIAGATPLTGTLNIPGSYATLAAAITDLNAQGVGSGGVTLNLVASNPQTAPAGGYVIGGAGSVVLSTSSASNPITIQGNGNTVTASGALTAGALNDAIFKLVGADWVTLTGFTMQENAANTTSAAATNNMTEFGVALFYVSLVDGAQNNTIQGNTISLNRTYPNTFGIYSNTRHSSTAVTTTAEVTSAAGSNSNNKVYGNAISNVNFGIVFVGAGTTIAAIDTGNDIGGSSAGTGNTITNWGGGAALSSYVSLTGNNYCIFDNQQINENISFNTITSAALTSAVTEGGILKNYSIGQPTGTITSTINNNTVTVTDNPTVAAGSIIGINNQGLTPLQASATTSINNNTVQNCVLGGSTVTTGSLTGITNLSLPGTLNMNGNSVLAHAITATTSTSGILNGISNSGAAGTVNMNNNIVRGLASTATSGQPQGITNSGAVVTALNINNNQLGNASGGFFSTGTVTTGALFGVSTSAGAATCALSIQSNDIRGITYGSAVSAAQTYFQNTAATLSQNISSNTFTNLNVNTTGSVTFLANAVTLGATGSMAINSNSIVTGFNKAGAGGTVTVFTTNASSVTGSTVSMTNNNFSNITLSGATAFVGINNTDGASASSGPVKTITGNTLSNISGGSGTINPMTVNFSGANSGVSTNTIGGISWGAAVTGLALGSSNQATLTVSGNTLGPISTTAGAVTGISNAAPTANLTGNTVSGLSSSAAVAVTGVENTAGTTVNLLKNKIYDLSGSNAATTVNGLLLSGGTTVTATNNLIGDLRATTASAADVIRGVSVTSATASSAYNLYFNTIYLNATSSGTNFGTTGIFHTTSVTATTAALTLRNNIVTNLSTPNGTGLAVALRRSSTTLTNYAAATNRNLLYAGTPGAARLIFHDGTNSDQTLAAYKTRVSTRDANAVTENPSFLSTTGTSASFLHVNPATPTQIESNASPIAGVTDDYDGETRNVSTPDIGADELPTYTLSTSATNGSVAALPVQASYNPGQAVLLTATASSGYHFVNWSGDASGTSDTTTVIMSANRSVTANFALNTFTITASAAANGSITPSGATVVNQGANQSFTLSANTNYHVDSLYVDGVSVTPASPYTFTNVQANHTIHVTFAHDAYTITASAGANGSITPDGATSVSPGGDQAFAFAADTNWHVDSLYVDDVSVTPSSPYTFTNVQANHTIRVTFAIDTYTITASAGANGSISPNGATSVNAGATQAFTLTPNTGYHVDSLYVDDVSVTPSSPYAFSNVLANHTVHATFAINSYTITASAGAHGSIAPSGVVGVNAGDSPAFTLSPDANWHVDSLYVDDVSVTPASPYTFTNVQANHTIRATFAIDTYTITASAAAHGSITPSGATSVNAGDNQAFSFSADANWHVDSLYVDDVPVTPSSPYTFTSVLANHTIRATFAIDTYTITASAGANGSIAPGGATTVNAGGSQAFTLTPNVNYHIDSLYVDGVPVTPSSPYTFTSVLANHTIHATFAIDTYTITASAGANGTISPNGATSVNAGGSQAFTLTPNANYHVDSLYVDGVPVTPSSPYTFTNVLADHTIHATFAIDTYTITASAGANGSISPNGATSVNAGGSQAFTLTPNANYHADSLYVDGVSVEPGSPYTFTNVLANHTIHVTFAVDVFTIAASAGLHGSIVPSGLTEVNGGSSQAYTISPAAHYHVDDVLVDGASVGRVTSYTFSNVTANHTIAASFAANPAVPAIATLASTETTAGNDNDGTVKILVSWTPVAAGSTVQVYHAGYGNYPEYDDTPGAGFVPALPSYPPSAPWVLTSVTAPEQTDEPAARDDYFFVAFVTDSFGTVSPVSNLTAGSLNYHLGDVTDNTTPGQGDNLVNIYDVSLLGAHYGLSGVALAPFAYLDVGPTSNRRSDGRPRTDDVLDFEDLVIFAINYNTVSAPQLAGHPAHAAAATDEMTLEMPGAFTEQGTLTARLRWQGTGTVLGLSAGLSWDPAVVRVASFAPGELSDDLGALVLSSRAGVIDIARMGQQGGLAGEGAVANVTFERVGPGDPRIELVSVDARDAANGHVAVPFHNVSAPRIPAVTSFGRIAPNPFRSNAALSFGLAKGGAVELAVYSVDGRLVRRLVRGTREAGMYQVAWDGRDEDGSQVPAGVYYARLVTPQGRFNRSLVYLK